MAKKKKMKINLRDGLKAIDRIVMIFFGMMAVALIFLSLLMNYHSQPIIVHMDGECDISNWEELPEDLSGPADLKMIPDNARCKFSAKMNVPRSYAEKYFEGY